MSHQIAARCATSRVFAYFPHWVQALKQALVEDPYLLTTCLASLSDAAEVRGYIAMHCPAGLGLLDIFLYRSPAFRG